MPVVYNVQLKNFILAQDMHLSSLQKAMQILPPDGTKRSLKLCLGVEAYKKSFYVETTCSS